MGKTIKVTVWNEFQHEKTHAEVAQIYPKGIHGAIADYLNRFEGIEAKCAVLDDPEHGLTEEVLDNTDVLFWWGHMAHHKVSDDVVERVYERVLRGMGLVALHSAHMSKIFRRLMGTSGTLTWRENGDKERLWVIEPNHPIAKGLPPYFELPHEETYGERFDIPKPDDLVFIGWFKGGEVFRSGCTYQRGRGKVFYFQPGHETFPTFHDENVQLVLKNAAEWAYTENKLDKLDCPHTQPLEPLD